MGRMYAAAGWLQSTALLCRHCWNLPGQIKRSTVKNKYYLKLGAPMYGVQLSTGRLMTVQYYDMAGQQIFMFEAIQLTL